MAEEKLAGALPQERRAARISKPRARPWRRAAPYVAATVLGTAACFFLHHLANRIPFELAQQRFADEFAALQRGEASDLRHYGGARRLLEWEFCQISLGVLAGALRGAGDRPLVDAVLIRNFYKRIVPGGNYCAELAALTAGVAPGLDRRPEKTRYWWGGRALMAIALRHMSILDLHRAIALGIGAAWLLLAAALALLSWRALLVGAPAIVLGCGVAGAGYFADVANGLPWLWTLLSASALALLLRWPGAARHAPLSCFVAGMGSAFLWLMDGHQALAVFLIGLIAWLGYERLHPGGANMRRACGCIALYVAGFAVCFALGQAAKAAIFQASVQPPIGDPFTKLFAQASHLLGRMQAEMAPFGGDKAHVRGCEGCEGAAWHFLPIVRDIRGLWLIGPLSRSANQLLSAASALAFAAAAAAAIGRALRGGGAQLAKRLLWLVALALLASLQFFAPSDVLLRNARNAFLLLAACWACWALALLETSRRRAAWVAIGCAAGLAAGISTTYLLDLRRFERAETRAVPMARSRFDVYLDHHENQLLYVKDACEPADAARKFFLHIVPANHSDLPAHIAEIASHESRDFHLHSYGMTVGGRCFAARALPDYDIAAIHTGQTVARPRAPWREFRTALWLTRLRFSVAPSAADSARQ